MKKHSKVLKEPELIHVKLEYNEVLQSKKDILSLQMDLIKAITTIKKYHFLRTMEMQKKEDLYAQIKQLNIKHKKLQTILPKLKLPKILQKHQEIEQVIKKDEIISLPSDQNLERQLQEIQNRLQQLQK